MNQRRVEAARRLTADKNPALVRGGAIAQQSEAQRAATPEEVAEFKAERAKAIDLQLRQYCVGAAAEYVSRIPPVADANHADELIDIAERIYSFLTNKDTNEQ